MKRVLVLGAGISGLTSAVLLGEAGFQVELCARDALLVHNYGHGGAGGTLSWGCAAEVLRLVRAHAS